MKIINFILSIYLVALSCLPCADMEESSLSHLSSEIAQNHEGHTHDKESDLCSPFCSCNCCGSITLIFVSQLNFELIPFSTSLIEAKETFYISKHFSNFYGSIWQPPQIA